ncbi:MAG: YceG family protein [Oscillospiraceae bacterium]|nr:YceG family protein [Oscillospiraceae bacterium]
MTQAEFTRYVGYENSDSFRGFLIEQFVAARNGGMFVRDHLPMAGTDEIAAAAQYTASSFDNAADIKKVLEMWLHAANIPCDAAPLAEIMAKATADCGANKKNTYFVVLCWLIKYLGARPKSLVFVGSATLRELYFLCMMSAAGVKVTLVTYGLDADFSRLQTKDMVTVKTGRLSAPIQVDFERIDLSKEKKLAEMRAEGERVSNIVKRLDTTAAGIFEDILKDRKTRVIKNGGIYSEGVDSEACPIPVYCAALIGFDDETVYTNMLVKFKESFSGLKKQLIFIEKPLDNPNADEVRALGTVPRTSTAEMIDSLALKITLTGDNTLTALARRTLSELLKTLNTGNQTVVMNYANKLITWIYRCTQARKYSVQYEDIPVILYYGDISQSELYFLNFMSRCGFDVIYISPNKSNLAQTIDKNIDGRMQVFELPQSKPSGAYPTKAMKMKVATVAYSAERDLDTMLYGGDTGIYRSFQFPNSQSVTLKTTFEEIGILWKQEARFRTGFTTAGNLVSVPNIFAKISGVENGNLANYWEDVRSRLTPETILMIKKHIENPPAEQVDISAYRQFYRNDEIDTERLKASTLNRYGFLPDRIQDMLFYKLQETISSGFIKLNGDELMCAVLHFGMNLNKDYLRLIQQFDFTRTIPKIVCIDAVEDTFTVAECVQTVLCNLIGFDVLVYTPTGYKNIETFVSNDAFEEHIMNQFLYDVEVPKLKVPSDEKNGGFFGRLFGKH